MWTADTLRQRSVREVRAKYRMDRDQLADRLSAIVVRLRQRDSYAVLPTLDELDRLSAELRQRIEQDMAAERNARALNRALAQGKEPSRKASRRRSDH